MWSLFLTLLENLRGVLEKYAAQATGSSLGRPGPVAVPFAAPSVSWTSRPTDDSHTHHTVAPTGRVLHYELRYKRSMNTPCSKNCSCAHLPFGGFSPRLHQLEQHLVFYFFVPLARCNRPFSILWIQWIQSRIRYMSAMVLSSNKKPKPCSRNQKPHPKCQGIKSSSRFSFFCQASNSVLC